MIDSGPNELATSGAVPLTILPATTEPLNRLHVTIDAVVVPAFVSVNNGWSWICLPAGTKDVTLEVEWVNQPVLHKSSNTVLPFPSITGVRANGRFVTTRTRGE